MPTKSAQEWSDFRSNLPAGVTLGTCPCSGFYYQNYCYHQGDFGESCDQVCSDKGSCNQTGTQLIGSTTPATDALNHCRTVTSYYGATSLGDTSTKNELPYGQLGCTLVDSTSYGYLVVHFNAVSTTCAASEASVTRYCACSF
ncbi:MAG: hypothetical protein H6622_01350 [Halobacteriovoraceae bacterium]|nr:hypothetical protein [Halobacteriovoraceae bacterium]